jgi:hypothetical protein
MAVSGRRPVGTGSARAPNARREARKVTLEYFNVLIITL